MLAATAPHQPWFNHTPAHSSLHMPNNRPPLQCGAAGQGGAGPSGQSWRQSAAGLGRRCSALPGESSGSSMPCPPDSMIASAPSLTATAMSDTSALQAGKQAGVGAGGAGGVGWYQGRMLGGASCVSAGVHWELQHAAATSPAALPACRGLGPSRQHLPGGRGVINHALQHCIGRHGCGGGRGEQFASQTWGENRSCGLEECVSQIPAPCSAAAAACQTTAPSRHTAVRCRQRGAGGGTHALFVAQ